MGLVILYPKVDLNVYVCVLGYQDPGKLVVSCFLLRAASEMVSREMVCSQQRQENLAFLEGRKTLASPEARGQSVGHFGISSYGGPIPLSYAWYNPTQFQTSLS